MKKVVRHFYLFQFFFSLLVWLPIFYEYQKRIGLNDAEIFSIQSIYYLVFCFLEIPTGLVADKWGARRCLRLGAATLLISNLLPIFAQTYLGFLFHFLLIALSRSLISGASSAYIYEYLNQDDSGGQYKQVEGNARAYGLFGKVIFWGFVGAMMQWRLTLPYWVTAMSALIAFYYAILLPDVKVRAIPHQFSRVGGVVLQSPYLFFVMVQGIAIFVLSRICQVNLFQPILASKHFSLASYGVIMSMMTVFEGVGSVRPNWMKRLSSDLNSVFILTAVMGVSLLSVVSLDRVGTMVALSLFSLATGLSFPIQRQLMNDAITDSSIRATLLSVESIIDRGVCALQAAMIGGFLQAGRLNNFLIISSLGTIALVVFLLIFSAFGIVKREKPIL